MIRSSGSRAYARCSGGSAAKLAATSRPPVSRRIPRLEPGTIRSASGAVDGDEVVAAVAEQREVVRGEPAQERLAFGELVRRQRRRARVELGDDAEHLVLHLLPVVDRHAHVGQHARDVGGERVEARRLGDPVDLDVDERFAPSHPCPRGARPVSVPSASRSDREQRMDDEMQREAVAVDLHRHRIDEERHVVVDDLDDRVRRLPAVLLDASD